MGKYIRKAKTTGEVAVMEVSQSSLGVRTRARTLALQESPSTPSPTTGTGSVSVSVSYLQLRSRRLQKPPIVLSRHGSVPKRHKQGPNNIESCSQQQNQIPDMDNSIPKSNPKSGSRLRVDSASGGPVSPGPLEEAKKVVGGAKEEGLQEKKKKSSKNNNGDLEIEEASFGENFLEFEDRERSTRESTPCSLIRNPDTIRTPCSTTRPSHTNGRTQNTTLRHIPTTQEMEEFFAASVEEQRRQFIDKYNFDPVEEKPLPGRYEWVKLEL